MPFLYTLVINMAKKEAKQAAAAAPASKWHHCARRQLAELDEGSQAGPVGLRQRRHQKLEDLIAMFSKFREVLPIWGARM